MLVIRPTVTGNGLCRGYFASGRASEDHFAAENGTLFRNSHFKVSGRATVCCSDDVAGSCCISSRWSGGGGGRSGRRLTKTHFSNGVTGGPENAEGRKTVVSESPRLSGTAGVCRPISTTRSCRCWFSGQLTAHCICRGRPSSGSAIGRCSNDVCRRATAYRRALSPSLFRDGANCSVSCTASSDSFSGSSHLQLAGHCLTAITGHQAW